MAELDEFQFDLEGYIFGRGRPVFIDKDGITLSAAEPITQDSTGATGTRHSGKDHFAARTWTFGAHVDGVDVDSALAIQEDIEAVWKGTLELLEPGEHVPLRYCVGSRTRRVYGRPRRFEGSPNNDILNGHIAPSFTFDQVDHLFYDDVEDTTGDIALVAVNEGGGTKAPFSFPLRFVDVDPDGTARKQITVGGRAPTAAIVEVDGPVQNAEIWVGGRLFAGLKAVPDGQTYTIDARPWMNTVTDKDGVAVGGVLTAKTWLSRLRLRPGSHMVEFKGRDNTGRARARVRWRSAHYSL